jgi:DNA polymerase V
VNVIKIPVSAGIKGFESPAADYQSRCLLLDDVLIERKSSTFIAVASGDSMVGFGIFDGDLLIVDRAEPKRDTDIVVAVLNGELVCKQLITATGELRSGNRLYKTINVSDCDDFLVEGVVIRSVRLFRRPPALDSYFS